MVGGGLGVNSPNVGRKGGFGGLSSLAFPSKKKNLDTGTSDADPDQDHAPSPETKVSIDPTDSKLIPKKPEGSAGLSLFDVFKKFETTAKTSSFHVGTGPSP